MTPSAKASKRDKEKGKGLTPVKAGPRVYSMAPQDSDEIARLVRQQEVCAIGGVCFFPLIRHSWCFVAECGAGIEGAHHVCEPCNGQ